MGDSLIRQEIRAMPARRALIVKKLDALIAKEGQAAVLLTLP